MHVPPDPPSVSETAAPGDPRGFPFVGAEDAVARLNAHAYIADDALGMSVFLAVKMGRPLFLEGAPGVGKTLLARVLSEVFDTRLIRLQCYEGLDLSQAA